ncbi:hypothetical protein DXN05_01970 [Deminuibacter soli]|uniref:Uncharacterized protein n=1 Tax=Deminuibacter soli TaxID=2291815 RepID=A0A3E1NPQ5_9BACT|nr:hypothetical protein DXN05_01970 [Deminuibacter soli]
MPKSFQVFLIISTLKNAVLSKCFIGEIYFLIWLFTYIQFAPEYTSRADLNQRFKALKSSFTAIPKMKGKLPV